MVCLLLLAGTLSGQQAFEKDSFETDMGTLQIHFIGHGTLMFELDGRVIHIDPYSRLADYSLLPEADLILITHEHGDHLDMKALKEIRTRESVVLANAASADQLGDAEVLGNGDAYIYEGIQIDAVPAYNIKHLRPDGSPFHPKGQGNGYLLRFGDFKIYVAGDTEDIPEMASLTDVDVAFLPMNLPYTMTPGQAAKAARSFMPAILYPYHFGKTDTHELVELLHESPIEVRIRKME